MNKKILLSPIVLIVAAILVVGLIYYGKRNNASHSADTTHSVDTSYKSGLLTYRIFVPGLDSYPDSYIWAGQTIYGYSAPLENYVEILPVKTRGKDNLESWIDTKSPSDYFLPLYDAGGNLHKAFWLTRTTENTLFLSSDFRIEFKGYLAAKAQVQKACDSAGRKIESWQLLSQFGAYMIVANTNCGVYGELFCQVPGGGVTGPDIKPPPILKTGVVLDENELVNALRTVYQ